MSLLSTLKRFGITTGATASAAAKASVIYLLKGERPKSVTIPTPIGLRLEIFIDEYFVQDERTYCASVTKFSGDNPDVLNGLKVIACSERNEGDIQIEGGKGIGVVTKPGLKLEVGSKAISPIAREMIYEAVREVTGKGVKIIIEVPQGEEIAPYTMNKDVGIENGISILGTTGIEYPVSDEDYIEHVKAELCVIKNTSNKVVLAPGNTSFEFARKIYGDIVVKIGDRVGDVVKLAFESGFSHVILVSLPGKITKVAAGLLNTHSKYGDARIETLTHASVLAGLPMEKVKLIATSSTISEAITYLNNEEKKAIFEIIGKRVVNRLKKLGNGKIGVIIISDLGEVLVKVGET